MAEWKGKGNLNLTDRKRFIPDIRGSGTFAVQSTEGFPSKTTTLSARYVAMNKIMLNDKSCFLFMKDKPFYDLGCKKALL